MGVSHSYRNPAWIVVLVAALLFVGLDAGMRVRVIDRLSIAVDEFRPPARNSIADGVASRHRSQLLEGADSYHWVMQTQRMLVDGGVRVRRVDYDNAPHGREVHWSSPLRWWLAGVGWLQARDSGQEWRRGIERAALYANALLLIAAAVFFTVVTARQLGAWPAVVVALGLTTIGPIAGEFQVLDHHGLAALCAFGTVFFLVIGASERPGPKKGDARAWRPSRRWVVASAVCGAIGMWISAASQIPVLVGVGIGGVLATGWAGGKDAARETGSLADAGMWRAWSLAGGGLALGFYLLEYFPGHMGARLEVNHPLYALAWAGAGELMARISGCGLGRSFADTSRGWTVAAVSGLAVLAPLAALLGPWTFVVSDPFVWRLHADAIAEFASVAASWRSGGAAAPLRFAFLTLNVALVVALPAAMLWSARRATVRGRALVALCLPPMLLTLLLGCVQIRWLTLACAVALAGLVAWVLQRRESAGVASGRPGRTLAFTAVLIGIFAPYPTAAMPGILRALRSQIHGTPEAARKLMVRDFAFWLSRRIGPGEGVVLSGPGVTTELIYHGGLRGVGTLYWENNDGLKAAAAFFGARDGDQAAQIVRERSITHVVVFPWDSFIPQAARLSATEPRGTGESALGEQLRNPDADGPAWLRPTLYRAPFPKDAWALVYETDVAQGAEDASVRRACVLLEMRRTAAGLRRLDRILTENPRCVPARVRRAQHELASGDMAVFRASMAALAEVLPSDPRLELTDRVVLGYLLNTQGHMTAAREQIAQCWAQATSQDLRRLGAEELRWLVRLARDFGIEPPSVELAQLARSLLVENGGVE